MRLLVAVVCLAAAVSAFDADAALKHIAASVDKTTAQLNAINAIGKQYPIIATLNADQSQPWSLTTSSGWTSGFYPGMLWLLYKATGDAKYLDLAKRATAGLAVEANNTGTHDIGFMIYCPYGYGYQITKDPKYKAIILQAAKSLATRYNKAVGCLKSWNGGHFQVIVDNMMNLELMYWAAQNGGDKVWQEMSISHSDMTTRDCIKPDGSSYHLVDYDPVTGKVLLQSNQPQGMAGGVWSRGQAWGLYGYVLGYRFTKYQRYLEMARKTTDYFLNHTPKDGVAFWDFGARPQADPTPRDASAAAITASALIELSRVETDVTLAGKYRKAAEFILDGLSAPRMWGNPAKTGCALLHACGSEGSPASMDNCLIFADYYYLEATLRWKGIL